MNVYLFCGQLLHVYDKVFGSTFRRIDDLTFHRGSVVVKSSLKLTRRPTPEEVQKLHAALIDEFERKGIYKVSGFDVPILVPINEGIKQAML